MKVLLLKNENYLFIIDLIIVFGVLCGVLLLILAFVLWKYMNNLKRTKVHADEISTIKNNFPLFDNNEKIEPVDLNWKLINPQISSKDYTPLVCSEIYLFCFFTKKILLLLLASR